MREHPEQRPRHEDPGRPFGQIRRSPLRDGVHRQGCEPDERDGMQQTDMRGLCAEPQQGGARRRGEGADPVHHHPLRQRLRLQRLRDSDFRAPDQGRRPGDGDGPQHHKVLHADSRGLRAGP